MHVSKELVYNYDKILQWLTFHGPFRDDGLPVASRWKSSNPIVVTSMYAALLGDL